MNILCELNQQAKLAVDDEKKDKLENIEKTEAKVANQVTGSSVHRF